MSTTDPAPRPPVERRLERLFERMLFRVRWLLAPFYAGLALALAALLYVFAIETWHALGSLPGMGSGAVIVMALSLIDLTLTANLLLIVIFSGYENYVSKMDLAEGAERPDWMGTVDFSGLKQKLMASIIAITAVALLRGYVEMYRGAPIDPSMLAWLAGLHITFVVSALLLALTDLIASRARH
ncbi:MAG TPA: TIGR00645 family protein [Allosphingosinicella sp.]